MNAGSVRYTHLLQSAGLPTSVQARINYDSEIGLNRLLPVNAVVTDRLSQPREKHTRDLGPENAPIRGQNPEFGSPLE